MDKSKMKRVIVTKDVSGWPVGFIGWYEETGGGRVWNEDLTERFYHDLGYNCELYADGSDAITHYKKISSIKREDEVLLRTKAQVENSYDHKNPVYMPEGSIIMAEFGFDNGLYGRVVSGEATLKCEVDADFFHLLEVV